MHIVFSCHDRSDKQNKPSDEQIKYKNRINRDYLLILFNQHIHKRQRTYSYQPKLLKVDHKIAAPPISNFTSKKLIVKILST
jgi:hypothetical protein